MNLTARTFTVFCMTGLANLIQASDSNASRIEATFRCQLEALNKVTAELAKLTALNANTTERVQHELSHFHTEFLDLLKHPSVERVAVIDGGILVTTRPISTSFKGNIPYEILLRIGSDKPTFRPIDGQADSFRLRCLDGAGHDKFMLKLLQEARLAEAAALAIDLIAFGDEGGPYNTDDDNGYY